MNQLTINEVMSLAPQAFAATPKPGLSEKYSFLPTSRIIEDMDRLGWKVSSAKAAKYRNTDNAAYGTHVISFFNPDINIKDSAGEVEAYPQVVMFNSHSGRGSFRFEMGIFRLVCSNGLVIKTSDMGSFKLRHSGYSFEDLRSLIDTAVERMPDVVGRINRFGQKIMSPDEQRAFAQAAFNLREDRILSTTEMSDFLESRRPADNGDSLWLILNRVQESVIRGGSLREIVGKGKFKKFKGIRNIHRDLEINQKLWEMAETFC